MLGSSIVNVTPVFCLSIHADYACRHAGACCTAGWHIPVEPGVERAVREAGIDVLVRERVGLTGSLFDHEGGVTVIRPGSAQGCVFFERGRDVAQGFSPVKPLHGVDDVRPHLCAIHRRAGHEALPVACQQFPRVSVTDARGTHVTLSHFCPTAARMLFRDDLDALEIVEAPLSLVGHVRPAGLDAREALPPLLRPGMLLDLESYGRWERHAVRVLGDERHSPESALRQLGSEIEVLRAWEPAAGPITLPMATSAASASGDDLAAVPPGEMGSRASLASPCLRLSLRETYDLVVACVPAGLSAHSLPPALEVVDRQRVAPAWQGFHRPLRRYLAAKAFASWIPWQAGGLRTWLASLQTALAVVRVEAARQCAVDGATLDSTRLLEAIRQADLLLVHKADSATLAERLSKVESDGLWRSP